MKVATDLNQFKKRAGRFGGPPFLYFRLSEVLRVQAAHAVRVSDRLHAQNSCRQTIWQL
jgi:hypothetical protein